MTPDEALVDGVRSPTGVVPVVASDWLRERLHAEQRVGVVVGAGERAAYVRFGQPGERGTWVLAIERHDAVGLPCGVRIPAPASTPVAEPGARVHVAQGLVAVGGAAPVDLQVVRWQRAVPVVAAPARDVVARRLERLVGSGHRQLPWWPVHLSLPAERLRIGAMELVHLAAAAGDDVSGDEPRGPVADLVGWGPGSTPSGDDLLAGFVATLACLGEDAGEAAGRATAVAAAVARQAPGRTTDLSATLLACALDGAMALPAAGLLHAVTATATTADRVRASLDHLLRIGHTSGHDLALGILTALHVATDTGHGVGGPRPTTQSSRLVTTRSH